MTIALQCCIQVPTDVGRELPLPLPQINKIVELLRGMHKTVTEDGQKDAEHWEK